MLSLAGVRGGWILEPVRIHEVDLAPIVSYVRDAAMSDISESLAWYAAAGQVIHELSAAGGRWQ